MYKKHRIEEEDTRRNCLVLHTEHGENFETKQITATISAFLKRFDSESGNISAIALCAGYATMMLQKYLRGKNFENWTKTVLLSILQN